MAEAIVGDLAAGLVRKLVSLAINDVIQVWKLDEDLETLRERFELIGALLHDAHAKNVIMSTAKIWFNKLEQVAHVTEAFMDELEYEVTRRKVEHHHKVRDFFVPSKNTLLYRFKVTHKIKYINTSFDKICKWATDIGLKPVEHLRSTVQHREIRYTQPFEDESLIVGRDDDISFLVNMLCNPNDEGLQKNQNCLIGQLGMLKNLRGTLKLYGLDEVENIEEARKAKLCEKSNIRHLLLKWRNNENEREKGEYNDEGVLEGLEPHPNLQALKIKDFMGKKLASWIPMMTNMVTISVKDCSRCEGLPSLGHLPKLRKISIEKMENVKVTGNDLCGGLSRAPKAVTTTMYPSVTKLILRRLPKLEEWVEDVFSKGGKDQIVFPKLEKLEISDCPRLRKILNSCFPSLKELRIANSESNMILETMYMHLSSLTTLYLENISDRGHSSSSSSCSNLESILKVLLKNNSLSLTSLDLLDCKGLQHLTLGVSLDRLYVYDCPNLVSINVVEGSAGLRSLYLSGLPSSVLDGISSQFRSSTLRYLWLGPFPDEFPWPFSSSLHSFPNLVWLFLRGWEMVKSIALFEQLQFSTFPTLTKLLISGFGGVKALVLSIAKLPSLADLSIHNCKDLERVSLFDESHCLQRLDISECPILKERYRKESGPEWFKIQHIPNITWDGEPRLIKVDRLSSINSSCTFNCVQIKHREMTMTTEGVVEENGKTRGDEYTKDGTVDLKGNPVLRSNTGRWRATSFIVGYEAFERMAFYGISTNLVLYLTGKLHEGTVKSSNNVTNWVGTVWLTPILGAYIADAHLGRYWTFIISAFIYLGGMSLLTLVVSLKSLRPPSCSDGIKDVDCNKQASPFQVGIFYCALYIIALGTGGTKPNISTMGADQFDEFEPTEKTQKISFFNWWVFSIFFGTLFASTFLVYIQDHAGWGLGYGLPTIGLFLSILVFLAGSPYYRHQPASGSPLTKMARVLIATIRKWKLVVPDDPKELHELNLDEYSKPGKYRIEHSPLLRILDKAAVVDGRSPHWMLCTVTEVEETKQMVKMVPILLVSFLPSTLIAQGHTLFIKQGTTLVRSIGPHFSIPPASLVAFITIFMLITVVIYDKFLVPTLRSYTKNPRGIPMLQRMGIGLVMHVIIMIIASVCERKRLNVIEDHGITKKNQIVPLSIFILLPQYALMGVADTFWEVGRLEFFYDQAPKSMKSLGTAYYTTSLSMGNFLSSFILTTVSDFTKRDGHKGWILDNLNVSRLDYFYAFYAVLSFINLLFFLLAANFFVYNKEQDDATIELENVKDTSGTNAFFKDVTEIDRRMADAFVADLASGLVRKLILLATEEVIQAWNLSEDLLTLRERLESIDALLSDTYTKKLDMSSVQTWFSKLKAVAHVADVFMDQLAYEIIRQKVESHHRVRDFFVPSKNNILNRFKAANKIKTIHKSFDKIFKWAADLGLQPIAQLSATAQVREIRHTTPFEDETQVVGRDEDVSNLVHVLSEIHDEDLLVVAVAGMGGQDVSTNHSQTVTPSQDSNQLSQAIYVRLEGFEDIKPNIYKAYFYTVQSLYSQASIISVLLPNLKHLRVLVLKSFSNELPSSIGNLKYLKHLDISNSLGCKSYKLPDYISRLYNLQTLRISALHELPKKACNLLNLRHLFVENKFADNNPRRCMFIGIERLICLQTLPHFVVSRDQNCLVGQLGGLKNLRGNLKLYDLRHVVNMEEASKAKLCQKPRIQHLLLDWSNNENEREDKEFNYEDVMKGLEPHTYLKELTIDNFMAKKFASWITMMDNLVKITLRNANRCEEFPQLGHLPKLREMKIVGMDNLRVIKSNFDQATNLVRTLYPSLTKLILRGLTRLEEWLEPVTSTEDQTRFVSFPKLEVLDIKRCSKLTRISSSCFPSLKELGISNLDSGVILETMSRKIHSLTHLRLSDISNRGGASSSSYINMDSVINKLLNNSPSLTTLNLYDCQGLTSITLGVATEYLKVVNCADLMSINVVEESSALNYLIFGCPILEVRCWKGNGIQQIPNIDS
ncbi:hypothetical protein ACET3Z_026347 [Daucus carota]